MKAWTLTVRARARADVTDIHEWYKDIDSNLAADFKRRISDVLILLEQSPEIVQLYFLDFRQALMSRVPYRVLYTIEHSKVIVFRMVDTSRDFTRLLPERQA